MPASVEHLLRQMSLEEKVAQLTSVDLMRLSAAFRNAGAAGPGEALAKALPESAPHGVGHFSTLLTMFSPGFEAGPEFFAQVQEGVMACGRFPIPALIHSEALNGVANPGAPTYPTGIAQAATWNPQLVRRMTELTRATMLALGSRHALSPVLDLARDARWGRVHETYGEDPDLAAAMGVAFVRGMQGDDLRDGVAACAKHFVAYSASLGGLNMAGATVGMRTVREQYARPFEAVIREAGVATAMNGYSEIDGVPVTADPSVLDTLLRDELGFDGVLTSDYNSLIHLVTRFNVAADAREAGRLAMIAGIDTEHINPDCYSHLPDLVRDGDLDESYVDRAALRVLRLKERLGLLDHLLGRSPNPPASSAGPLPDRQADHAHSRAMAGQAVVLLHNDGVLPVANATRLALVGTLAAEIRVHYGAYNGLTVNEIRTAAQEAAAAGRRDIDTEDSRGMPTPGFPRRQEAMARELEPEAVSLAEACEAAWHTPGALSQAPVGGPEGTSAEDAAEAARVAAFADVAVVVVGERTGRVGPVTAGESYDRQDLRLPGDQERLVEAVAATGTPTVVVLVSGRPLLLDRIVPHAAAVLWAPLLGPFAGPAVADILTGTTAPSGRLPVTFPASLGQVPIHHGTRAGSGYTRADGRDAAGYADGPTLPQFAFGHGLTYTEFAYGEPELAATEVAPGGEVAVTVPVTNTGERGAPEVVQLYARDVLASTARPVRQLVAFDQIHIPAGTTRRVRLTAPVNALALINPAGQLVVEPGEIELLIGASSADIRSRTTVHITGKTTEVPREARFLGTSTAM